jgi:signal transduction histidine kinase
MLDEARWNAAWPPAAIGSTAMLAVLPWLITLTGRWSRRLQHIQQQVAAIARNKTPAPPATQAMPHRGDELAAVLEDVQALAERLRELQEQLLRTEREQLVAQLVTGFAHQFRNGLSGVSLALQVHQTRCRAPADRSLEILHRQLQLLETEVRGLLSLDKRAASVFTQLDLAQILRESISLVEPALEHHNVRLHVVAPPSLVIPGIRDSLRAACVNLLQNAAEAAGPGGEIQVLLQQHPQHALIQISDNGHGPPPEIAPRMQEAFVTTKAEGLGLGLAIVNAAAQVHKGTLNWKREQNWTTMELTLPVNQESGDPA